jgi:hypothetical protein
MLSRRRPWSFRSAEREARSEATSVMATFLNKCPARMSPPVGWLGPSRARLSLLFAIALVADGCAPSGPQPRTVEHQPFRERAETRAQGDLVVIVALPTAAEAADIYGAEAGRADLRLEIEANGADA